jgi:hypothetical protein
MRPALSALSLVLLAACKPDALSTPTIVQWMEWPAEVTADSPFEVRMIMFRPCFSEGFTPGASIDQSAITFAPVFHRVRNDMCLPTSSFVPASLDTAAPIAGLRTDVPRTFEIRATSDVYVPSPLVSGSEPVRTFGQITVVLSGADPSRRNAAGRAYLVRDTLDCPRVQPNGFLSPGTSYVLDDPADTTGLAWAFVRGYIYAPAAPVCGETEAFHIVSRN